MFSVRQKRDIANKVQEILQAIDHRELPVGEIKFSLHVAGATPMSWADIRNNGAVGLPSVNPHNEEMDEQSDKVDRPAVIDDAPDFRSQLCELLNHHSCENRSDTPDFILREFLCDALNAFDSATRQRSEWYNRAVKEG